MNIIDMAIYSLVAYIVFAYFFILLENDHPLKRILISLVLGLFWYYSWPIALIYTGYRGYRYWKRDKK